MEKNVLIMELDIGQVNRSDIYILGFDSIDLEYNTLMGIYGLNEIVMDGGNYISGGYVLVKKDDVFILDKDIYMEVAVCNNSKIFTFNKDGIEFILTDKILHGMMYKLNYETIRYFEKFGAKVDDGCNNVLFKCIDKEDVQSLYYIYSKRNFHSIKNEFGDLDLWYAMRENKIKVIKFMIENLTNLNLNYALKSAIFDKKYKLALYLVMNGANTKELSIFDRIRLNLLKKVYQIGSTIRKLSII